MVSCHQHCGAQESGLEENSARIFILDFGLWHKFILNLATAFAGCCLDCVAVDEVRWESLVVG